MEDSYNACENIYGSTFKATLGYMLRKLATEQIKIRRDEEMLKVCSIGNSILVEWDVGG